MMTIPDKESVRALCREALLDADVTSQEGSEEQLVRVVQANLDSGRFKRFAKNRIQKQPSFSLRDYIRIVIFYLSCEHRRISDLERGDPAAWLALCDFLARRAQHYIEQLKDGVQAHALALDFAHDACLTIFEKAYPFDVAFEAWATVILKNAITTHYTRSGDASDRIRRRLSLEGTNSSEREAGTPLHELLPDERSPVPFQKIEDQELLREILDQLPRTAQRKVIEYTFFYEQDDDEIAKRLGRSKQAVYNLRNRALVKLKSILDEQETKENRRRTR